MAITDVPAELMLHVTTYLDPTSTLQFALSCRANHAHCKSRLLEHTRLFAEYRIIDTSNYAGNANDGLIWSTLKEVLHDPSKGWYIRELNLPGNRHYCAHQSESDRALLKKALYALEGMYPSEEIPGSDEPLLANLITRMEERITLGHDDAIIAILIHHLPFLKVIRITGGETDCLEQMIQWIAFTYQDAAGSRNLPFQHLQQASIAHGDTEFACNVGWACSFLSIPSLRGFAANAMGCEVDEPSVELFMPEDAQPRSNVEELVLEQCVFEANGLKRILAGMKNLKMLHYTDGGSTVSYDSYTPKRTIQAIASTVGHCLERLTLNQSDYGDIEMGKEEDIPRVSLRDFRKLKMLQCEWHMLAPDDEEGLDDEPLEDGFHNQDDEDGGFYEFDVLSILPESLQELYVSGGKFTDAEWDHIVKTFEEPSVTSPRLNKLRIEKGDPLTYNHRVVDVLGDASAPPSINEHPLGRLLEGHGAW